MMITGRRQVFAAPRHPKGSAMKRNHLRKISCGILAGTLLLGLATPLEAQSQPAVKAQDRRAIRAEITPQLRLAVKRGLSQLVRQQRKTNSFASEDYTVAVHSLMGMALLAGRHRAQTEHVTIPLMHPHPFARTGLPVRLHQPLIVTQLPTSPRLLS